MPIEIYIIMGVLVGLTWVIARRELRREYMEKREVILRNIIEVLDRPDHTPDDTFTALQSAINNLTI